MQRGYSSYKIDTKEKLYEAINELLFIVVDSRDLFFSFRGDEKWNFAVYLFHEQSGLLKPVWRNKHQRHPSRGNGRHWRPGQGHVGAAYANGQTVITQDSTAEDVANLLKIDENSSEPYDKTAYRSYVSVPIGPIGDTELPMGVLVATSNEPSRFNLYNALVLRHAAGELANLIYLNKIDFSIMFIDDVVEPEVPDK